MSIKKFAICVLAVCSAVMAGISAEAKEVDVYVNKSEKSISISGDLGTQNAYKIVSVIVTNTEDLPSFDEIDFETGKSGNTDSIYCLKTVKTDEAGKYNTGLFEYEGEGVCKAIVSVGNSEPYSSDIFLISTDEKWLEVINKVIASTDPAEVKNLLDSEEKNPALGIDMSFYKLLSNDGKLRTAKNLLAQKEMFKLTDTKEKINAFDERFVENELIAYVCEHKDANMLSDIMENTLNTIPETYSENVNKIYNTMKDLSTVKALNAELSGNKSDIYADALERGFYSAVELNDAVAISEINYKFAKLGTWKKVKDVLKYHQDVLSGLNFTKLDAIGDIQSVYSAIFSRTYAGTSELSEYTNKLVNEYKQPGTPNYDNVSPGGGGTIKRGNTTTVAVNPIQNNNSGEANSGDNYFEDIKNHSWAANQIKNLMQIGVISKPDDKKFNPDRNVSREEFVKMVVVAFGLVSNDKENKFNDVKEEDWFYEYVKAAFCNEVVNGISEEEFGVGKNITRQDMAVIVCNAMNVKNKGLRNADADFKFNDDAMISDYALESVYKLYNSGVINGADNNNFEAKSFATRAQAAVIIYNAINYKA